MKQINNVLLFLLCLLISCDLIYAKTKTGHLEKDPAYDVYQSLSEKEKEAYLEPLEYVYIDDEQVDKSTSDLVDVDFYLSASSGDSSYNFDDIYKLKNYTYSGSNESSSDKNQGALNVCWAFATNNAIESYLALHGITDNGKKYNLSENYLEYVSYQSMFNQRLYGTSDVRGPYTNSSYQFGSSNTQAEVSRYLAYGYAPETESVFGAYHTSYQSGKDPARGNTSVTANFNKIALDVTGLKVFNGKDSSQRANIKAHIIANGGIYTGINVGGDGFTDAQYDFNKHFLYNGSSVAANHAVTIVGWDNNYSSSKFSAAGTGAWIAVNSWGSSERLFYISYNDKSLLAAFVGISEVKDKSWTTAYRKAAYDKSTRTYEFQLDKSGEMLHSIKILAMGNNSDNENILASTSVSVTKANGVGYSNASLSKTLYQGIITYDFSDKNIILDSDTVYVKLSRHVEGDMNAVILYTSSPVKYNGSYMTGHDYMKVGIGTTKSIFESKVSTASGVSKGSLLTATGGAISSDSTSVATGNYLEISYTKDSTYSNSGYGTIAKKIYAVVNGDVNGDGQIKSNDYILIKKHIMEKQKTDLLGNTIKFAAADYNNDKRVNSTDYVKIKQYIMSN